MPVKVTKVQVYSVANDGTETARGPTLNEGLSTLEKKDKLTTKGYSLDGEVAIKYIKGFLNWTQPGGGSSTPLVALPSRYCTGKSSDDDRFILSFGDLTNIPLGVTTLPLLTNKLRRRVRHYQVTPLHLQSNLHSFRRGIVVECVQMKIHWVSLGTSW